MGWAKEHLGIRLCHHKGHKNLAIRAIATGLHCVLSVVLVLVDVDVPHTSITAILQFLSAITLLVQFRTANPYMFIARAICNWARCIVSLHGAICGREWPGEVCDDEAWADTRWPSRALGVIGVVRSFFNGLSLALQYKFPRRGVGLHGNEQLFFRGWVQASGIVIQFAAGMLKLGRLSSLKFERGSLEIIVNFIRAFFIIPLASWSLFDQWVSTGSGKKTDDIRTCHVGEVHPNAADKLTAKISPHKGHRNLMIRCIITFAQACLTFWLIVYGIDIPHQIFHIACQLASSATLFVQWRVGNPKMFILRGSANFVRSILALHAAACGRKWPHEGCVDEAWSDFRQPFRVLALIGAIRFFMNGMSLCCQYKFAHRMLMGRGHEQLFYRGSVQAIGLPLSLAMGILKLTELADTKYERLPIEIAVNFLRCLLVPVAAGSLFHQWWHTHAGNSGHPVLDAWEDHTNPNVDHPLEQVQVSIISAKGLRRHHDIMLRGIDAYCICRVPSRMSSSFSTNVVTDSKDPQWGETRTLPEYKARDSIEFTILDEFAKGSGCCWCLGHGEDLLGKATLKSTDIHPTGFDGDLVLENVGKGAAATLKVKVQFLQSLPSGSQPAAGDVQGSAQPAPSVAVEDVQMTVPA
eukprot:gnl/TRDRNA2_/TRDRNA2_126042_c0_seq2.p1 gnl/TRDRNA2_/TRDRNA2_126042_c0~~gnl/TRDRNA2_/TRDRNA2_126042_c0_seq2.p1  ORF type:complete len:637 (-),score=59.36 gnl/TRDRNA2_/TRDRNA2_126042_c0_seq2:63-1973(-)